MDKSVLLNAALDYALHGCKVFPLNGKIPAVPNGNGCRGATNDPVQIRSWWANKYAGCNIGIATGTASGFWVLDVDGDDGKSGYESIEELEAENGQLPATVRQKTGNGEHLLFRMPDGFKIRNSASKVGPNLDVRGDGGYIVAAPSIHPHTERPYQWQDDGFSRAMISDAPDWLLKLATHNNEKPVDSLTRMPANSNNRDALSQECDKIRTATNRGIAFGT